MDLKMERCPENPIVCALKDAVELLWLLRHIHRPGDRAAGKTG